MINQGNLQLVTQEDQWEIIDLLLKLSDIDDKETRSMLTTSLDDVIKDRINSSDDKRSHISDIVNKVCGNTYGMWIREDGRYPIQVVLANAIKIVGGGPVADELKRIQNRISDKLKPPSTPDPPTLPGTPVILKDIAAYKVNIDNLLEKLLSESWLNFKSAAALSQETDRELRDIMTNLEKLKKRGEENKVDLDAVLSALYEAYAVLIQALILSDEANVQERIKYPEKIKVCRDNLNKASGLLIKTVIPGPKTPD